MVGVFLDWKPHLSKPCSIESVAPLMDIEVQREVLHGLGVMSIEKNATIVKKGHFPTLNTGSFL